MPAIYYVQTTKEKKTAKMNNASITITYTIRNSSEFWQTSHTTWKIPLMLRQKSAQSKGWWWNGNTEKQFHRYEE